MKLAALIFGAILAVGYPFIVYFGLGVLSPRTLGGALLALYVIRLMLTGAFRDRLQREMALLAIMILVLPTLLNQASLFLFVPVALNIALLVFFLRSLFTPPAIIELFARKYVGELNAEQIRYCRAVTWSWVWLFGFNGAVASLLAWRAEMKSWMLFNGLIAYFLIGGLFVGELFYRHWRFRHYVGLPTDFVFKRIFPPRDLTA